MTLGLGFRERGRAAQGDIFIERNKGAHPMYLNPSTQLVACGPMR